MSNKIERLKVLIFDIETSYLEGIFWDIWEQTIMPANVDVNEWSIIAYSAKWLDRKGVLYKDNRNKKDPRDDKEIVKSLRDLLDEADIVITKNGKKFDEKMFNARCAKHRIEQPSPFRHLDTERVVRRKFRLVSYSLEYLCEFFDLKHKKLKHGKFPGMKLWRECIAGNIAAWDEMSRYNKHDVLATEDLYHVVKTWDNTLNFDVHLEEVGPRCNCGSTKFQKRGFNYTNTGKFQRLQCQKCCAWLSGKTNLLTKEKRASLLK